MTKPYCLMADCHAHAWQAFATTNADGVNSRLQEICDEIMRAGDELSKAGGDSLIIAGDLFHTRGHVTPEVFNPVRDALVHLNDQHGINTVIIPGNHDLTGRDTTRLGSSVAMLDEVTGVQVVHKPTLFTVAPQVFLVPWCSSVDGLIETIRNRVDKLPAHPGGDHILATTDLIIHRGIDGTLAGMHDTGLTADKLASFGFRRVFAGDYHQYHDFGNNVYSIGALVQQTWSDVGTKAGFLLVYPDRVQRFASHAPSFIDLDGSEDMDMLPLTVDGNYVRAKIGEASAAEVASWRQQLLDMGAKGVVIQAIPKTASERREGVTAKSISSLPQSVSDYVRERGLPDEVGVLCDAIMKEIAL